MLILSKSVFLMIPRTGSTWVRQALRSAGVRYKEWGAKHAVAPWRPDGLGGTPGFRFTFVRDPTEWVRSRWTLGPWEDELKRFWRPDPDEFCHQVTPAMAEMYFGKYTSLCPPSAVGHLETAADDLVRILELAGETFNERDLRRTPPINESGGRLDLGAFYELLPEQWCQLPAEDLLRMPTDLLPQLPDAAFDRLSAEQMRQLTRRLTGEAVPRRPRDIPILADR